MKKIIFTIIALTVCVVSASSQTMTVKLKNGQKVTYQTSEVEDVKFEEAYNHEGATYHNGHEYVDLGLPSGKLWATCNVGASKPEEIGYYFSWGETEPKDYYSEENSECYGKDMVNDISGTEYDVAHVKWGGKWRMPTMLELSEMSGKCTWGKKKIEGTYYFIGTGPNGNSIIFPAASWMKVFNPGGDSDGAYWSSEKRSSGSAKMLWMISATLIEPNMTNPIYFGQSVRPIFTPEE